MAAITTAVTTLIMAIPTDRLAGRPLLARIGPLLRQLQIGINDQRTRYALARLFAVALGLAAITWGATTFPLFWWQLSIERTAAAIADRSGFKPHSLDPLVPAIDRIEESSYCRPEAVRSAAMIRLRLAEEAVTNAERDAIDPRLAALQASILKSLACAPSDPFLWMTLAWVDQMQQGFRPQQLTYLRLSYQLGPYEGWIADRRNRLALSMFWRLPPDLADAAIREFAAMVNSQFYEDAIVLLTGPGWPLHDRLLAGLADSDVHKREDFARELYAKGYDLPVPGVPPPRDPRPW
jgi:hypothetical protein